MLKSDRARSRTGWVLAAMTATLLLATACSSDSKSSTSSGSGGSASSSGVDLSVLGTENKATGTPVTIGMMTSTGSAIDAQSQLSVDGAKIAVSYANDYLGGIAGHPIDLFVCSDKATPAGTQDCANQFVEKKVSAVVWPFTGEGNAVPIIAGAGIPIVISSGASSEELTTPGVFQITGGYPGVLGAYALDSKNRGFKKFAMIVTDVPAATQGATSIGGITFGNAGVAFSVIPAAPGTADLTPQLQQAASDGADAIGVTGDVTFCTSFLQAYDTLGLTQAKYVIATCNDESVVKTLPTALEGVYEATLVGSDAEKALYGAMVTKYGDGKVDVDPAKSSGVAGGVTTIMNFESGLKGYTGDVSAAALLAQWKVAKGTMFLSGELPFTCDGTAIPLLKNICSASYQMAVLNGDATPKSVTPIDASAMFATH